MKVGKHGYFIITVSGDRLHLCKDPTLTLTLSLRREREVFLKELPLTPSSKKRGN
jgi:hypothetical protein